ncbi:unnamed protein product, partial [Polarella glacialis]
VHRWCYGGKPVEDFAAADERNSPHLNCCVCGGGSFQKERESASGLDPAKCSSYSACAHRGDGDCCPGQQGLLECCKSNPVCRDSQPWFNGYTKCVQDGFSEEDGCTPSGVSCHGYEEEGLCSMGKVIPGKEWSLGSSFNHPERHCCVCGGGTRAGTA